MPWDVCRLFLWLLALFFLDMGIFPQKLLIIRVTSFCPVTAPPLARDRALTQQAKLSVTGLCQ